MPTNFAERYADLVDRELAAALAAEDQAEDTFTLDADDRRTCYTHRSWATDCAESRLHANRVTGHNWCREHNEPVIDCRCRPATAPTPANDLY